MARQIDPEIVKTVRADYPALRMEQIAVKYGLSLNTVRNYLKGYYNPRERVPYSPLVESVARIVRSAPSYVQAHLERINQLPLNPTPAQLRLCGINLNALYELSSALAKQPQPQYLIINDSPLLIIPQQTVKKLTWVDLYVAQRVGSFERPHIPPEHGMGSFEQRVAEGVMAKHTKED